MLIFNINALACRGGGGERERGSHEKQHNDFIPHKLYTQLRKPCLTYDLNNVKCYHTVTIHLDLEAYHPQTSQESRLIVWTQ